MVGRGGQGRGRRPATGRLQVDVVSTAAPDCPPSWDRHHRLVFVCGPTLWAADNVVAPPSGVCRVYPHRDSDGSASGEDGDRVAGVMAIGAGRGCRGIHAQNGLLATGTHGRLCGSEDGPTGWF